MPAPLLNHPRLWTLPGVVFSFLLALLGLYDWWTIGVIANPAVIAEYHFGSEAMIDAGGARYASAALYAYTGLCAGLWFALLGTGFVVTTVRSTGMSTALLYGFLALSTLGLLAQ